jgi:PPP family 3-phenylpropionic acid transporter
MSDTARLRLVYFLYYGAVGAYLPYFAAYLRGLGFSGEQIGRAQMVGPLAAAPVALLWAQAADRLGSPARALRAATLWALCAAAFLPFAAAPLAVAGALLVLGLGDRAVVPLLDSVAMELTRRRADLSYGAVRLFGSLGYALVAAALGVLLALRGSRPADPLVPWAFVACVAGYALTSRRLPDSPPPGDRPRVAEAAALLRDPHLLLLFAAAMVHWGATAPYHVLLGVRVHDLGLAPWVTGAAMATGVGAEVVALFLFSRLEGLGPRGLFSLAFAGTALRWLLCWQARSPAALIGVQLLHGLTFGVFWGASVRTMGALVPPRLRATGQALFSAVVFSAGNALGYELAGQGYDRYGSVAPLFAWAAGAELLPLLAAALLFGRPGFARRAAERSG